MMAIRHYGNEEVDELHLAGLMDCGNGRTCLDWMEGGGTDVASLSFGIIMLKSITYIYLIMIYTVFMLGDFSLVIQCRNPISSMLFSLHPLDFNFDEKLCY
jgi:hypothetical protein